MSLRLRPTILAGMLLCTTPALAGMSPNPLTFQVDRLMRYRIEALSFFMVLTFVLAGVVMLIWNALRQDFPRMPRLGYWRALGFVFLWGLLVAVVLSMITGARELMTPGAWERSGATFRIAPTGEQQMLAIRRQKIERLKECLWAYAEAHQGKPPEHEWMPGLPEEVWEVPGAQNLRYIYVPRTRLGGERNAVVAYEPDLFGGSRFALLTDGSIKLMTDADITAHFVPEPPPDRAATRPAAGGGP